MKNKILIELIVPNLSQKYEIYIPVNERISKVKELVMNSLVELSDGEFDKFQKYSLMDPETGSIYASNLIIRDTNIKNSKKVILF